MCSLCDDTHKDERFKVTGGVVVGVGFIVKNGVEPHTLFENRLDEVYRVRELLPGESID